MTDCVTITLLDETDLAEKPTDELLEYAGHLEYARYRLGEERAAVMFELDAREAE